MYKVNSDCLQFVGSTPLVKLEGLPQLQHFQCSIYAKLEHRNPTGSATDRVARELIELAVANGDIQEDVSVVCGGSSDLCLSAGWVCAVKGHRCILIPEGKTTKENLLKMSTLGATVIPVPTYNNNCANNYLAAEKLCKQRISVVIDTVDPIWHLDPSTCSTGEEVHFKTTAAEIASQLQSPIDMIVCGDEAHGILSGICKKYYEPKEGGHQKTKIIGVNFEKNRFYFPERCGGTIDLNSGVVEWTESSDKQAYTMTRRIHREEGILVGPRAGAVLDAALRAIEKHGLKDKSESNIVVVLNGAFWNGNKDFISIDWMVRNGYMEATKMESLYWWYEMPLMDIHMEKNVVVDGAVKISEAIEIMSRSQVEKSVVVRGEEQELVGIALKDRLLREITHGALTKEDPVEKGTVLTGFCTVDFHADIRELEEAMHGNCWAVVTQTQTEILGTSQAPLTKTTILGVIDQVDHVVHLNKLEEFHKVNYNIIMTDGIPCETWFTMDYNAVDNETTTNNNSKADIDADNGNVSENNPAVSTPTA